MHQSKRMGKAALLLLMGCMLCACARQTPEMAAQKLIRYFGDLGYTCTLSEPLTDGRDVPIYQATAWRSLMLNGQEEVLVYFDESNRADYLSARVTEDDYGLVTHFGLRFVLMYQGADENVLAALEGIPNE